MQDKYVNEESRNDDDGPLIMNAFEMITLSQGLNLSALFDRRQVWLYNYYMKPVMWINNMEEGSKSVVPPMLS